jgi:hypothetical protein
LFNNSGTDEEGNYTVTLTAGATYEASSPSPQEGTYSEDNTVSGAYVSVPSRDYTNAFTISLWFYSDAAWSSSVRTLYTAEDAADGDGFALVVSYNTLRFYTSNGSSSDFAYGTFNSSTGAWHHVVAIVDRTSSTCVLWVNGSEITTDTGIRNDFSTEESGRIGYGIYSAYSGWLNGYFDDVQIYDWNITNSDIAYLYANPGGEVCD